MDGRIQRICICLVQAVDWDRLWDKCLAKQSASVERMKRMKKVVKTQRVVLDAWNRCRKPEKGSVILNRKRHVEQRISSFPERLLSET